MTSATDAVQRSLTDSLADELRQSGVPGGAAAISWQGREMTAANGMSSMRTLLPVTDETLFRAGSITKTVVATAVMKLAEEGAVALADPVRRHLPDFSLRDPGAAESVTVGDLLTHRGGWQGDFIDFTGDNDDALALHVRNMRGLPQIVPPGQVFSYSNAGFCVLGRIVEVLAGEPVEQALRHLVLEPLGVHDVRFSAAETITGCFAVGHERGDGGPSVMDMWELPRCARPAGGIVATARTLSRFAVRSAAGRGHLSAETRELMITPQVDAVGTENLGDQFGLGWFVRDLNGTRMISHAGDVLGQHALMLAVPDADFAVAVTVNGDAGAGVCESVCRRALTECLGLGQPADGQGTPAAGQARTEIAGRYESPLSTIEVTLGEDGSAWLTLEPKPPMPGWPVSEPPRRSCAQILDDDIIALTEGSLAGSRARVIRADDGPVAFLRVEGRLAVPVRTAPPA